MKIHSRIDCRSETPYRFARKVLLFILRARVYNEDQFSAKLKQGRAVVCCNHVSYLDGIIICLASPRPMIFPVDTDYSVKSFGAKLILRAFEVMGFGEVVPMDTKNPLTLRHLKKRIDGGDSVLLFPEGRISTHGQIQTEQPGLSWLIKHCNPQVIHMRLEGIEQSALFSKSGLHPLPITKIRFCTDSYRK
ncbi:lysophospholipid acyltransferase family protein [Diaphorobacter sp. LR2014-1]|uniref:lysophospholipid acyltransferase family protein n=1 Tax=Diaphorobacter sp. LR2014-1 TaxID=1933219 RepID=UPI000CDB92DF|nr:lysophospholipid acyltransferase family protein [Diaphorobacter sp. LR2014-1]